VIAKRTSSLGAARPVSLVLAGRELLQHTLRPRTIVRTLGEDGAEYRRSRANVGQAASAVGRSLGASAVSLITVPLRRLNLGGTAV
jgi:hypothetical protein